MELLKTLSLVLSEVSVRKLATRWPIFGLHFISILFIFFFTNSNAAAMMCPQAIEDSPLTVPKLLDFVDKNKILDKATKEQIHRETQAYAFNGEDMGPAFLLRTMEAIGTRPSRKMDLIYTNYLKPIFVRYEIQFSEFLRSPTPVTSKKVPAYFGLDKSLRRFVKSGELHWNAEAAREFQSILQRNFHSTTNINLKETNALLVQLVYLYESLTGKTKLSADEIQDASRNFAILKEANHIFIPAIGEWDIPNVVSQWFLRSTVNMVPPRLTGVTDVHGGLGGLEGITHDHGHVFLSRTELLAKTIHGEKWNAFEWTPSDQKRIDEIDQTLQQLVTKTLMEIKAKGLNARNGTQVVDSVFFIVHEPKAFSILLNKIKSGQRDWSLQSQEVHDIVSAMRKILEQEHEFYPNLGTNYAGFERAARFWVSHFGSNAAQSPLPGLLQ